MYYCFSNQVGKEGIKKKQVFPLEINYLSTCNKGTEKAGDRKKILEVLEKKKCGNQNK